MNDKARNYQIDNLRAIAIIIVVLGHSIILYSSQWNLYSTNVSAPILDHLKKCINVIQMPLFISLSGYLYAYSSNREGFFSFLLHKAKRILVPFLLVGIFWMIPVKYLVGYYAADDFTDIVLRGLLFGNDSGHLWFLPFLFGTFILSNAIVKLSSNKNIAAVVMLIFGLFLKEIIGSRLGAPVLNNIALYYIWFGIGYSFNMCGGVYNKLPRLMCILAALIVLCMWYIGIIPDLICSFILLIALFRTVPCKNNSVANKLSQNSFGIYLFHSPLIYITYSLIPNANPIIIVLLNFAVFGGIAFLITEVIRRTPMKLCIGE